MDDILQLTQGNTLDVQAIRPSQWDFIAEQVHKRAQQQTDYYAKAVRGDMNDVVAHQCLVEALDRNNTALIEVMKAYSHNFLVTVTPQC
jgi:hypothetical protein